MGKRRRLIAEQQRYRVCRLERIKPVYETFDGWRASTKGCRRFLDLPVQARGYLRAVETLSGTRISWVSVGPEREAMIEVPAP